MFRCYVAAVDPGDLQHPSRFAASAPDRPAVIVHGTAPPGDGAVLTYGDLEARSNQVAHLFRSLGLGVGDHVAVVMENRAEYFEVVWGAMRSGLFVTPINWHLAPDEARYVIEDCGARALVASASCAELVAGVGGARFVFGGTAAGFDAYQDARDAQPPTPVVDECEGN